MQTSSKTGAATTHSDHNVPATAAVQVRHPNQSFLFKGEKINEESFGGENGYQGGQQQLDLDLQVLIEEGQMPEELKQELLKAQQCESL